MLLKPVQVDKKLQPGVRVTIKRNLNSKSKCTIVSPTEPRTETGIYWGYQVRYANAFRKIIFGLYFKKYIKTLYRFPFYQLNLHFFFNRKFI